MYLHLGMDIMVDTKEIVGIFDIKTFSDALIGKNLIQYNKLNEKHASYIITKKEIIFSEIAAVTLKKRMDNIFL